MRSKHIAFFALAITLLGIASEAQAGIFFNRGRGFFFRRRQAMIAAQQQAAQQQAAQQNAEGNKEGKGKGKGNKQQQLAAVADAVAAEENVFQLRACTKTKNPVCQVNPFAVDQAATEEVVGIRGDGVAATLRPKLGDNGQPEMKDGKPVMELVAVTNSILDQLGKIYKIPSENKTLQAFFEKNPIAKASAQFAAMGFLGAGFAQGLAFGPNGIGTPNPALPNQYVNPAVAANPALARNPAFLAMLGGGGVAGPVGLGQQALPFGMGQFGQAGQAGYYPGYPGGLPGNFAGGMSAFNPGLAGAIAAAGAALGQGVIGGAGPLAQGEGAPGMAHGAGMEMPQHQVAQAAQMKPMFNRLMGEFPKSQPLSLAQLKKEVAMSKEGLFKIDESCVSNDRPEAQPYTLFLVNKANGVGVVLEKGSMELTPEVIARAARTSKILMDGENGSLQDAEKEYSIRQLPGAVGPNYFTYYSEAGTEMYCQQADPTGMVAKAGGVIGQ